MQNSVILYYPSATTLAHAIFISYMNYCGSFQRSVSILDSLYSILNTVAKASLFKVEVRSCAPMFKTLWWFPLLLRVKSTSIHSPIRLHSDLYPFPTSYLTLSLSLLYRHTIEVFSMVLIKLMLLS